ncbi:putative Choline-phosphate cytidylyltransferase [Rhodotorula taiwanensis]|uniref:choline-phosphate cytidylyltransferase n=1 Tax=Rhodotorula taiwanensis TaxID=741276 RepID=A0A2S5B478_9BASI|nr:putative Choline-phosphate cytidylyltransferase [Rhodotorula taiwanensis]
MTAHSANTPAGSSPSAATSSSRRRLSNRRLRPEGEGQSSREASAESNDETSSPSLLEDDDDDDNVSLSAPRTRSAVPAPGPASASRPATSGLGQQLGELHLGDVTPQQLDSATPAARSLASSTQLTPGAAAAAGEVTEGYDSAHDGDVSSATAGSSSVSAARLATHPHAFRAPVSLHPSSLSHPHPNPHSHPHSLPLHPHFQQTSSFRSSASETLAGKREDDEEEEDDGYSPSPPSQTETETDGEPLSSAAGKSKSRAIPSTYPERRPEQAEPVLWAPAPSGFLSSMTAEDIQAHIRRAIEGDPGRSYKIKAPPTDRPVRIYADGVYDLLHYGHMLQLRQCKLMFPSVYLLVGVCSSALVEQHKSHPVFSSEERYESMRHIRWVDEVIEEAPWQVDQEFIDKWQIDYIAHDEEPYASAGKEDVYAFAKSIGSFLPTKRTNGISTSELLQRIVEGYREGEYDSKLRKIGHPELCSQPASVKGEPSVKAESH